jgi:hypothetical protein
VEEVLDLATETTLEADSLLTGLIEVLYASMLHGYRQRLAAASPAGDPPVTRVLSRLAADLESVREGGARLVGEGSETHVSPASDAKGTLPGHEESIERLRESVTRAGGIFGSFHY